MTIPVNVLICDDEPLIRWALREHLEGLDYRVFEAENGADCLKQIEAVSPDLLITDLRMPEMGGLEVLRRLRQADNKLPVIVLTAFEAIDSAIEATRLGAHDYLSKPFDLREVEIAIKKALKTHRLQVEVRYLKESSEKHYGQIVGESPAIRKLLSLIKRLEHVDPPAILIRGETGTGKDLVAKALHDSGSRSDGLYVEVDCAALPETLIESELFGHERGAFTDAKTAKPGLFEIAKGGTLFLDEIGELSVGVQSKLLRVLENRRFRRVGGVNDIQMDAQVITATNRNLAEEVENKTFRQDLYYRLNVVDLLIPPLRERRTDVPLLVEYFVRQYSRAYHRDIVGVSEAAMDLMCTYSWPGNVRELRNVIERVIILEADDTIEVAHLPLEIRSQEPSPEKDNPMNLLVLGEEGASLEEVERTLLEQALTQSNGNQVQAAKLLDISRYALRYRMEKHGIRIKRKAAQGESKPPEGAGSGSPPAQEFPTSPPEAGN